MSTLIDKIIADGKECTVEINKIWYVAKPLGKGRFKNRIKDAIRILSGTAKAFHYKEDER